MLVCFILGLLVWFGHHGSYISLDAIMELWPYWNCHHFWFMMTSSNGSIFRVIGHLCGEFTGLQINGWVNNREAGNLRRIRPHYNVTVMCTLYSSFIYQEASGWSLVEMFCTPPPPPPPAFISSTVNTIFFFLFQITTSLLNLIQSSL